jgi:hypothetical protein
VAESKGNEGIQVFGGSITVGGSAATGRDARASSVHIELGRADLDRELNALRVAIERHGAALADAGEAMADARALGETLAEPEPEPSRVASLLARLRDGAGQVAEIATSLTAIETLVGRLL